jgi:hypothetical protein
LNDFQPSNGFIFRKDQNLIKKYDKERNIQMVANNQDGVNCTFFYYKIDWNANFRTLFWCKMLNIGPKNIFSLFIFGVEIQDGVELKNGALKRKIIILLPYDQKSTYLKKSYMRFVCPTSVCNKLSSPRWCRK